MGISAETTDEACWRVARADRAAVIIDADDYFRLARRSMLKAKRRIMLVGWDFDGDVDLDRGAEDLEGPRRLGDFLCWLVTRNPELEIFLLRWDIGFLKMLKRRGAARSLISWLRHPRIHFRLDRAHPAAGSHHQKIVVIDDALAFCGGIDMLDDRWDTREHADGAPGRKTRHGKGFNKPWHDATTALDGAAAAALGELCRHRWEKAGGKPPSGELNPVDLWPESLAPAFTDVDVTIARTAPGLGDDAPIREIEALYLEHIAAAHRVIYAESQYFASRRIAEALARRLDEPDGPEIVLVNPDTAEGWLEPIAMDTARARLVEALRARDVHGRFRLYHPVTADGEPIYVHAKMLFIDDAVVRVGSSNMNNRSLRLDTECDVAFDARLPANAGIGARCLALRDGLIAEHLGVAPETVSAEIRRRGSLIAAIEALRGRGKTLVPYETPEISDVKAWLADNEILDPEGGEEAFEAPARRGLFRRLRKPG